METNRKDNHSSFETKIQAIGYFIEPIELKLGNFVRAVRTGNLIYTSGQIPIWGNTSIKGKVGQDITIEQASEAAKLCTLNGLRAIKTLVGSLDNIVQIVKVLGMVNVAPGFDNTSEVIDGCSIFLKEIFGDAGNHSRSAVGMVIPQNFAVEIEMVVEVKSYSNSN